MCVYIWKTSISSLSNSYVCDWARNSGINNSQKKEKKKKGGKEQKFESLQANIM